MVLLRPCVEKARGYGKYQFTIFNELSQRTLRFAEKVFARLLTGGRYVTGQRRACDIVCNEVLYRRKLDRSVSRLDRDIPKTSAAGQGGQLLRIRQTEWRVHEGSRLPTDVPLQQIRQLGKPRALLKSAPDHYRKPPSSNEHSVHFSQRRGPVGKELQAELAIYDIKDVVREWQLVGVSLLPVDRRARRLV